MVVDDIETLPCSGREVSVDEVWDWHVVRRRCRGPEGRGGGNFFLFSLPLFSLLSFRHVI